MTKTFLGQTYYSPIKTYGQFQANLRIMSDARLKHGIEAEAIPQELKDSLLAWTNQAMALQHVPGWVADPVELGVLVVRQYKVGQFLWQSKPYPAEVVARAFKDLDVPHLQVDRELMEARLENHLIVPYWERQA